MATSTNTEKQCRCVLLLTKAGGEMLRGLVRESVSASGSSLDGFLQAHYYRITHVPNGRERNISWAKNVLFPPDGSGTDIHKWELNVLCFIVVDICTLVGHLHPTIVDNVEDLKSVRNKLYHAADMTDDEYEQCAMQIENKVISSCKELNNATLLTRVEEIVESIKHDPLSSGEISKILVAWKNMDMRVLAGMNDLHDDHKEIIAYQKENLAESKKLNADQKENLAETKKLITGHEEVKQQLAFLVKQMVSNPKPPVVHAKIQFTNSKRKREVNDSVVIKINAYIQQQKKGEHSENSAHVNESSRKSREATSVDTSKAGKTQRTDEDSEMIFSEAQVYVHLSNTTETKKAIMACIDQKLEQVLNELCNDGTTIKKCYTGSVHLILQCSSVTNLMNKLTECLEGKTTKLFIPVQTALRQLEGCEHICLDVILLETWYWECMTQIVECLEENINEELHKMDNVDTMSPEHEDTYNLDNIYISVKSAAQSSVLEDMRKRCFSVEMMQKITGLTEAMKNHFETKTFALEINVHKLSLLDSDEAFVGSTSPSSTTDTVSNIEQSPLVYTSTTATSLPVVTTTSTQSHPTRLASDSDSGPTLEQFYSSSSMFETVEGKSSSPITSACRDDNRASSQDTHSQYAESSSSMFETARGKTDIPCSSPSRDDNRASSREPLSQSAESSSSMFEIIRGKTGIPRSSAYRDDTRASSREPLSQSAESSSSMFEIIRGKTDRPRSSAYRDDTRASSREPHSQSAESSSSSFHPVGGTFDRPHWSSQTAVGPSEAGFNRDSSFKLLSLRRDQEIEANMEKYRSLICRCICEPHVVDQLYRMLKDFDILQEDLGEVKRIRDNPQRAVEDLISLVYQSLARDKWEEFANAIGLAGYPYLKDLLFENKPYHKDRHYQNLLFHICNPSLEKKLQVSDVIPELHACNAITDISMQQVLTALEQKGNTYATVVLLERMQCRKANLWYTEFLNILHRLGYQELVKTVEPDFPDLAVYSPCPEMQLYQLEQMAREWEQRNQELEQMVREWEQRNQEWEQRNQEQEQMVREWEQRNQEREQKVRELKQKMQEWEQRNQEREQKMQEQEQKMQNRPLLMQLLMAEQQKVVDVMKKYERGRFDMIKSIFKDKENDHEAQSSCSLN